MKKFIIFILLLWTSASAKNVVLYIDHASLPTLQQLMHFVKNQDPKSAYGFAFKRIQLQEKDFSQLEDFYFSELKESRTNFKDYLIKLLDKYGEDLEVEIHSNLFLSLPFLEELFDLTRENKHIKIKHLYFYDDGSKEYELMEALREKGNISQLIDKQIAILRDYINNGKKSAVRNDFIRYVYGEFFPTTYTFLRKDYFDNEEFLQPLRDFLSKNNTEVLAFDYQQYQALSPEKQQYYLQLLQINPEIINEFSDKKENIIFIGTNERAFENPKLSVSQYHIDLIKKYLDKNSEFYIGDNAQLFFKGHPAAKKLNQEIAEALPELKIIPGHVSFEVLLMLDAKIDRVSGFQSSIFMSLPPEKISNIFFTHKYGKNINELLKNPLIRVFYKLNKLQNSQLHIVEDFVN